MKTAILTLALGHEAFVQSQVSGPIFEGYARQIGAAYHPIVGKQPAYPQAEKFRIKELLETTYDRIVFFDIDVVLSPTLGDLFAFVPETHLGLHDDLRHLPKKTWLGEEYVSIGKSQGWLEDPGNGEWGIPKTCYNTGVIVASRQHAAAFTAPEKPYPITHCAEQSVINWNIKRFGLPVHPLPLEFNKQWWMERDLGGFNHVYHFASGEKPLPNRPTLMRHKARELGHDVPAKAAAVLPQMPDLGEGPGTELKTIIAELGFKTGANCGCETLASQMNRWGVDGCRNHRDQIIEQLRKSQAKAGWVEKVRAAAVALASGLAFKLDPLDPASGLLDEAIRRAEAKDRPN